MKQIQAENSKKMIHARSVILNERNTNKVLEPVEISSPAEATAIGYNMAKEVAKKLKLHLSV